MKTILILATLFMVGCATTDIPHPVVLTPPTTKIDIPDSVLIKCPPLPKLAATSLTESDILDWANKVVNLSEDCRGKDSILVDTVRKSFNIPMQTAPSK